MVRATAFLLTVLPATCLWAAEPATKSKADPIIERYLALPYPQEDRVGENRSARLAVLRELEAVPQDAVASIAAALKRVTDARQRAELVEVLWHFRRADAGEAEKRVPAASTTPAPARTVADRRMVPAFPAADAAKVLIGALQDSDAQVRWNAIHALRLLAGRVDRSGGKRELHGEEYEPAVPGLLPHLIKAANDPSDENRLCALYALADTQEPAAAAELERRLKDTSPRVRLKAACFLTEFNNAAGLPEMKDSLRRLLKNNREATESWDTELLLASFERITGKSFGNIPMNPMLSGSRTVARTTPQRYRELLKNWADWWDWDPKAKPAPANILP